MHRTWLLLARSTKPEYLHPADHRHRLPCSSLDNMEKNAESGKRIQRLAVVKDCNPARVAIAWLRCWSGEKGMGTIVPIPGSTTKERVRENSQKRRNLKSLRRAAAGRGQVCMALNISVIWVIDVFPLLMVLVPRKLTIGWFPSTGPCINRPTTSIKPLMRNFYTFGEACLKILVLAFGSCPFCIS